MPSSIDDRIDALYQLPLGEFTPARNALAREGGARAGEIKRLEKPSLAAWAVNQLFWRDRPGFDRLTKASTDLRAAHVKHVSGRSADLSAAEGRHRDALAAMLRRANAFLDEAGSNSPAAHAAVERTLQAVPAAQINGRLTRPIDPVGFGLLADLMHAADRSRSTRALADVVSLGNSAKPTSGRVEAKSKGESVSPRERAAAAKAAREAAADARKRVRDLERKAEAALDAERSTKAAFTKAKQAVERADARVEQLDGHIRNARREAEARRDDLERARAAANDAAAARVGAERRLREAQIENQDN